jgi:hypothetical protein
MLSMWSCKANLDEENLKYAVVAEENGFGLT